MARIRTIKPEFPQSETIGKLSRDARLLFIQLWTIADDSGRSRGNSRILASLLYPYDDLSPSVIDRWIAELQTEKCLVRYEADGNTYIQILNWLKHQKIDKPSASRIPEFGESSRILANNIEASTTDLGPRTSTKDLGMEEDLPPSSRKANSSIIEEIYLAYPRKEGKGHALKSIEKALRLVDHGTLLAKVRLYAKKCETMGQDRKFIPHPATWFNGQRWEDETLLTTDERVRELTTPEECWPELYGKDAEVTH